jgi:CHAD domain-containing protein/CYTH domain-containing protein
MAARVDNLRESTDRSVRLVALGHLADATAAHSRLSNETDDEALHDFRVALRRLRSWERAFRPYLRDDLGKKLRRRLRDLAHDTGDSRDLEVHLAWLGDQRRSLGRRQRAGLDWLVSQMEHKKAEADHALEKDVDGRFTRLEARLARALEFYRERIRLRKNGRAAPVPVFAEALAPRVRTQARELERHLGNVHSERDVREGHEARIAAKRLRYLLEPVMKIIPGAADLVDRLKSLQDVLGDLHDAQVFGAEISKAALDAAAAPNAGSTRGGEPGANLRRPASDSSAPVASEAASSNAAAEPLAKSAEPADSAVGQTTDAPQSAAPDAAAPSPPAAAPATDAPSSAPAPTEPAAPAKRPNADIAPGLTVIMERLRARATAAFSQFSAEWLGDKAAGVFRDVDAVADRIAQSAREGQEIERKYLLRFVPEKARDSRWVEIAQGYLPGSKLQERIRRVSVNHGSGGKDVHYYRTMKLGEGVTRTEVEEETTEAIFLAMWPLTKRRRLRKRRFEVDVDGLTWEIDEFKNRDLVLAEVELDSEDDEVTFPDWLAPAVQREVTGEPEFLNINLAR